MPQYHNKWIWTDISGMASAQQKNEPAIQHNARIVLKRCGVSDSGAMQFSQGHIVTDKNDRLLIAAIVQSAVGGHVSSYNIEYAWPRKQ